MNKQEQTEHLVKLLAENGLFVVKGVEDVNHTPHQFTIGAEHIRPYHLDTSKPCAGYVNDNGDYSNRSKPGFHKCGLPFEAHTYDTVLFLSLTRNISEEEAQQELKKITWFFNRT